MGDITVWTRDHDWRRDDGEVSHAVCRKTEHPQYDIEAKQDKDITILHLCKSLMFTKCKFVYFLTIQLVLRRTIRS